MIKNIYEPSIFSTSRDIFSCGYVDAVRWHLDIYNQMLINDKREFDLKYFTRKGYNLVKRECMLCKCKFMSEVDTTEIVSNTTTYKCIISECRYVESIFIS